MDGDMNKNEVGDYDDDFKVKVQEKINEWLGKDEYKILFQWWDVDTVRVVAQAVPLDGNSPVSTIYFLRLFTLGDDVAISQDGEVEPNED